MCHTTKTLSQKNRCLLQIEALEERALMSVVPVATRTVAPVVQQAPAVQTTVVKTPAGPVAEKSPASSANDVGKASAVVFQTVKEGTGDFGNTRAAAKIITAANMMDNLVQGKLATSSDVDVFSLTLQAGQALVAKMDRNVASPATGALGIAPKMTILDSQGIALATDTGSADGVAFRAPAAGTYYVSLSRAGKPTTAATPYTLHLRPIGLDDGQLDPKWLKSTGAMYAFLDGNRLAITGPTGHGFTIRADWDQTTTVNANGLISSTYSAHDVAYLQINLAGMEIPLPLGGNALTITTKAQKFGDLFGEVKSTAYWSATTALANTVLDAFGPQFGEKHNVDAQYNPAIAGEVGLKLGSDPVLQMTGAPLNAAVPYLFINGVAGITSSLGNLPVYNVGSLVVDPADPFVYVSSSLMGDWAFGLSRSGLIPFKAAKAPGEFHKDLFGHIYVNGSFKFAIGAAVFKIEGDLVLNVDAQRTGQLFGGTGITSADFVSALVAGAQGQSGDGLRDLSDIGDDIAFGHNGALSFVVPFVKDQVAENGLRQLTPKTAWVLEKLPDELTLAESTMIYDGPAGDFYFRGGTHDYLEGTPLDFLNEVSNTQIDVDLAFKHDGSFFMDAHGQIGAGLPIQGRVLAAHQYDLNPARAALINGAASPLKTGTVKTTGMYVEGGVDVFGNGVMLRGCINQYGDMTLSGTVSVNLGGVLKGEAKVTYSYNHVTGFKYAADLNANYKSGDVKADVKVHFDLGLNQAGHVTYSGSGTAKVKVKVPVIGWKTLGSFAVGVNNDELWFKAAGHTYHVPLH